MMEKFVRLAATEDIQPGQMKAFEVEHYRILVAHTREGFFAVSDECSHDSAPISSGNLYGHEITCPRHQARFDVRTGSVKAPPAVVPIDTFEVRIEDNSIFVRLED